MRRSTVLSLPLQLVFPGLRFPYRASVANFCPSQGGFFVDMSIKILTNGQNKTKIFMTVRILMKNLGGHVIHIRAKYSYFSV